jgi:ferric iron reductase protein FhuF
LKLTAERLGAHSLPVCASALVEAYAGGLARAGFDRLLACGRAPDLTIGSVLVRFGPAGAVTALPVGGTPGPPDREREALARLASQLLDGHLAQLVGRLLERRVRRGPRALWGLVANACAAAILQAAASAARPPREAAALAAGFFGLAGARLPSPPLVAVTRHGRVELFRRRVTCCLAYRLPAGVPCATCPMLDQRTLHRRLAATHR